MSGSSKVVPDAETALKQAYDYHAHDYHEVLTVLGAHEDGLSDEEVKKRQRKYGLNRFAKENKKSVLRRVIEQLSSPLALVLVVAFLVTLALAEYIDASVIAIALAIAVIVGILQEGKASRAFAKLSNSQTHTATVLRAGQKHEVDAQDVTVGDIVILKSGMQVPADIRVVRAKQLSVNEATLTGEWQAVEKQEKEVSVGVSFAERASMAWMGTYVAEGYGFGVVVAIGENTAVGQLAKNVRDVEEVKTPLQNEMQEISQVMLYIIVGLVGGIFMIGLIQGQTLHEMLIMSIAIAVASVPEGLPAAVTIILAVGMEALLKRGGLVRNLLAAETLGSTTYVLTDKTGTLTEGIMAVTGLIKGDAGYVADKEIGQCEVSQELLAISLAAVDAYTDVLEDKSVVRGDAVERAILLQAAEVRVTENDSVYRRERIDYLAFTSEQRFAASLSEVKDEEFVLCVNGAPGLLLAKSSHTLVQGERVQLNDSYRQLIQKQIDQATSQGKRLVAVAKKEVEYDHIPELDRNLLLDLTFVGVLVLDDPVREGVTKAIEGVKKAGAEVILITGDNPQTALSIATDVGIATRGETALTGADLEQMTDDEILLALDNVKVFARVLPRQKMHIASLLQSKGEIVAMTGDGINDAPALRRANIGIAIGSGTEVAKESSDLVLVKDSFATIYSAIEEGRRIIANLRKIVGYLLSTSLSEVVLIGAALLIGAPVPILPAQILWANVIEEGLMSVAFAFEKGDKNAMQQKPQDIHLEGILSKSMIWFIVFVVTILSMLTLTLYFYVRSLDLPIETLRSIMFLSVAIDSLFISFAFRSLNTPLWRIPLSNNWFFIGSFLVSVSLLVVVLTIPFFQYMLSYQPLPLNYIGLVVLFSLISLVVIEIAKWLYFERKTN